MQPDLARAKAVHLLMEYFESDENKVHTWLETVNPGLGGIKPIDLINMGRGHKVVLFIEASLEGY